MVVRHSAHYGIQVTAENVMITSGSQQALDLLGKILINRGDRILVESPTYLGALQAWNAYGAEYVAVPSDENGMITDALENALRTGPKFIYVLPNFQNPTGTTLILERRKQLVELADRYGVPIIEDDPYCQLRFEGQDLPTVVELDGMIHPDQGDCCYRGNVIYLSTFSKILAPGIRLAWVIAPPEVIRKLAQAKQGCDLQTATFTQMVAYEVGKGGFLYEHVKLIRKVYHERRDVMMDVLEETMPTGVSWTHPLGGLFLWVTLPENVDTLKMLRPAIDAKVAFVPGNSFYPCGGGTNTMRLNFSNEQPERIQEGILRLAQIVRSEIEG
jgi:2-aminoadipate transaminase